MASNGALIKFYLSSPRLVMPRSASPMPSIINAVLASIFSRMESTVPAMPIASAIALNGSSIAPNGTANLLPDSFLLSAFGAASFVRISSSSETPSTSASLGMDAISGQEISDSHS